MRDDHVAQLVHDLRNPLAVIYTFARILEDDGAKLDAQRREEYIRRIRVAAEEMTGLLDRV